MRITIAILKRAMIYRTLAKFMAATLYTTVLIAQITESKDSQLTEAKTLIRQGAPSEAIELLRNVVEAHPHNGEAHLSLGSALSMIPRRSEAIKFLLRGLELRPGFAPGYTTAGIALARLGEQDAALQVFEQAIQLGAKTGDVHFHLALILASKEKFIQAIEHMTKALTFEKNTPKKAHLHFLLGKLHAEQNSLETAVNEFEHSIKLDRARGEVYLALGATQKKLLREDEAHILFEQAVLLDPENPTALYHLALELLRRGDAARAVEHLLKAHKLRPNYQPIVYNLTRALYKSGRKAESSKYRQKLAKMLKANNRARENAFESARLHGEAVLLEKSSNYVEALQKYRAVLEFEPLNLVARRNMALVLCRLNRWEEGIEELQEMLRHYPDDAETARSLTLVLDEMKEAKKGLPKTTR
jgi:tetratricopeptide (TPR) repeat protein